MPLGHAHLEQPPEVKKRIGYLPETPPIYPEMEAAEYLKFVGKLEGLSGLTFKSRSVTESSAALFIFSVLIEISEGM